MLRYKNSFNQGYSLFSTSTHLVCLVYGYLLLFVTLHYLYESFSPFYALVSLASFTFLNCITSTQIQSLCTTQENIFLLQWTLSHPWGPIRSSASSEKASLIRLDQAKSLCHVSTAISVFSCASSRTLVITSSASGIFPAGHKSHEGRDCVSLVHSGQGRNGPSQFLP